MKIFHLTYWYPNRRGKNDALWVKQHIDALALYVDSQYVYHFQVDVAKRFAFSNDRSGHNRASFMLSGPMPWWSIELLAFCGLLYLLLFKARRYDIINVHIGYPLLTYFHLIRKWVGKPVVITEHWSAYHFNFGVEKKLPRIQRIFRNAVPVITVSNSLLRDIQNFTGENIARHCVIPNAIDTGTFYFDQTSPHASSVFFMLGQWRSPKRPALIIQAFRTFIQKKQYAHFRLRIGGAGPQRKEIQALVSSLDLDANVSILGDLSPTSVASEMNKSAAFLHCSDYETFSVVCAEAICCGTPVVASAVGGIPEFIHNENGILVETNTVAGWRAALENFKPSAFRREEISRAAAGRFGLRNVGKLYLDFLAETCDAYQ